MGYACGRKDLWDMPVVERLIEVWEPFVKCLFTPRVCVFGVAICQLDWCDHKLSRRMVVGHLVIFQMHMLQFPVCVCVCVCVCVPPATARSLWGAEEAVELFFGCVNGAL